MLDSPHSIIGRAFKNTDSSYQNNEYERHSKTKAEQRDKILKFILSNHAQSTPFLISLPGKYWFLENRLVQIDNNSQVTGVEKSPAIYSKHKPYMPCKWSHNKIIDKSRYITDSKVKLDIHVNSNSIYVLGDLATFTEESFHNYLCFDSGSFRHGFINRTCVWYDFTASLNNNTYKAIESIRNIRNKKRKTVVCLTLMLGRDQIYKGSGLEKRIDIIKEALPELEIIEYWKYKGLNDTPMYNVCGIIDGEQ